MTFLRIKKKKKKKKMIIWKKIEPKMQFGFKIGQLYN